MADKRYGVMVEDRGFLVRSHLKTFVVSSICRAFWLIWVLVQDSFFISSEEPLLPCLCIDMGSTFDTDANERPTRSHVSVSRSNLEVAALKVALESLVRLLHSSLRNGMLLAGFGIHRSQHFVEPGQSHVHPFEACVVFVGCRHICKLVLDHCIHLTNGEKDAAREFVLIVDAQPFVEHGANMRLKDLSTWKCAELLVLEDVEVLGSLGAIAKVAVVGRRRGHLAEDLLGCGGVH